MLKKIEAKATEDTAETLEIAAMVVVMEVEEEMAEGQVVLVEEAVILEVEASKEDLIVAEVKELQEEDATNTYSTCKGYKPLHVTSLTYTFYIIPTIFFLQIYINLKNIRKILRSQYFIFQPLFKNCFIVYQRNM